MWLLYECFFVQRKRLFFLLVKLSESCPGELSVRLEIKSLFFTVVVDIALLSYDSFGYAYLVLLSV